MIQHDADREFRSIITGPLASFVNTTAPIIAAAGGWPDQRPVSTAPVEAPRGPLSLLAERLKAAGL